MSRRIVELNYNVDGRTATIRAMDSVGPDDCFEMLWRSTLHRYATGEDLTTPIPRDVKDWMIKTNRFV